MQKNSELYDPAEVRQLFNQMSATYHRMNYLTSFGFSERWRKQFLRNLPAQHTAMEVIDLMTGMGEMWKRIMQKYPQARLTALDFSENMLQMATKQNENEFRNEVHVLQQDLLNNNLESNFYDVVICAFGLKTFDNEQLSILAKETKRILKEGGRFAFVEISEPTSWILKPLYTFYLKYVIPVLGKVFLGNPDNYRMLWQYTHQFKNAQNAHQIFQNEGLETHYSPYFFGCASGIHGKK
jgi:demethylmenaquinone methyltransferase/2-methoxy-6-polyprenyl-1,4-benzoquinol methylase